MKVPIWIGISLLFINGTIAMAATHHDPCRAYPTHPGWHVFVDHKDRFCFEYPPKYKTAPAVFAPGYAGLGQAKEYLARLTTNPTPTEGPSTDGLDVATIEVYGYKIPFQPDSLTRFSPTGEEDNPPEHIHAAHKDFYFYGGGGGGVLYPDVYYFGLHSQMFSIDFAGPYSYTGGDKRPAATTRQIETLVLASFRTF